jgi:hypothetical protein
MMPEFEFSKMTKWASGQASDGHLPGAQLSMLPLAAHVSSPAPFRIVNNMSLPTSQLLMRLRLPLLPHWELHVAVAVPPPLLLARSSEYLGSFGLGPFDVPGGRVMADTTSIWILELLELYHHTGDVAFLKQLCVRARSLLLALLQCLYHALSPPHSPRPFNGLAMTGTPRQWEASSGKSPCLLRFDVAVCKSYLALSIASPERHEPAPIHPLCPPPSVSRPAGSAL